MKFYMDVKQRSEEWDALRLGIPTASAFSKIICGRLKDQHFCPSCGTEFERKRKKCECGGTPTTRPVARLSTQQDAYFYDLLSQYCWGSEEYTPESEYQSMYMQRGIFLEAHAIAAYEMVCGTPVVKCGFVSNDAGTIGGSPDGLVGEDGLIELKIPKINTHIRYLCTGEIEDDYNSQAQGLLWLTGRRWCDVVSYTDAFVDHPDMMLATTRVPRDEAYIAQLEKAVTSFSNRLEARKAEFTRRFGAFVPRSHQQVEAG